MNLRDKLINSLPTSARQTLAAARRNCLALSRGWRRPDVVRNHGVSIRIGPHLPATALRDLYSGTYEGGELKPLRMHLRPDDRVMEVGTGLGFVTMYAARIVGDKNVFTYEANPANEVHIRENFRLNGMSPRLTIGLLTSASAAESSFYVEDEFWSSSPLRRSESAIEVLTPSISLADEVRCVAPTCLVTDIEGGELAFYRDCPLDEPLRMIVIELHPYVIGKEATSEVRARIEGAGFRSVWECDKNLHVCYIR